MLEEFSIIGPAIEETLENLGEFLWDPEWEGEAEILKRRLVDVCRQWDDYLGADGALTEAVESLSYNLDRGQRGQELYCLLLEVFEINSALECLRAVQAKEATIHAARMAETAALSLSLRLGKEDLYQRYSSGEITRDVWVRELSTTIRRKRLPSASRWGRLIEEVLWVADSWDESIPTGMRGAYAKHAVCAAGILLHVQSQVLAEAGLDVGQLQKTCEHLSPLLCAMC